jgi:hypothetical protein
VVFPSTVCNTKIVFGVLIVFIYFFRNVRTEIYLFLQVSMLTKSISSGGEDRCIQDFIRET